MKSKMKKIATAVVSGAAALQSTDIDGTVALAALGRLEIATKELRSVKRTASGEPEAAAAAERVKRMALDAAALAAEAQRALAAHGKSMSTERRPARARR